jgi:hypothetical protein
LGERILIQVPHYLLDGRWRQLEHWPDRSVKAELGEFGSVDDAKASLPTR